MLTIEHGRQALTLLPERAVWWAAQATLLVADVHIGKGASFRQRGMGVPTGSSAATLARLQQLVAARGAQRLVVLGDFLHAVYDERVQTLLRSWLLSLGDTEVVLVLGNHDRALTDAPLPGLRVVQTLEVAGLQLVHDAPTAGRPALLGHLHPCVLLAPDRSDRLRLPAFWRCGEQLILPAFGSFTGGQLVRPQPGDQVFAIADQAVLDVTALALGRRSRR